MNPSNTLNLIRSSNTVVYVQRISPDDLCPTGVEAAAADSPNLGYCGVSRKLMTISIKI